MKIHFNIQCHTEWGQTLCLIIYSPTSSTKPDILTMKCVGKTQWILEYTVDKPFDLTYKYTIQNTDSIYLDEFGSNRILSLPKDQAAIHVVDTFRRPAGDSPFMSDIFKNCFFKRENKTTNTSKQGNLTLQLNCAQIETDRYFAIIGNQDALGNWDVKKKVKLNENNYPLWKIELDTSQLQFPLEYKFLIVDAASDEVLAWGGGANRKIESIDKEGFTIVTEEHFERTLPSWKAAGVAIPIFSLRSKKSYGIGEFEDLKLMVDWAAKTGQRLIQTLPINDTILYHTNYDSYPYNAVSVYALHPIYLRLDKIAKIKDKERKAYFEAKRIELNEKTFSDYQHVMDAKWEYFEEVFPLESKRIFESSDYKLFFEKNKEWLVPYAAFSYLRNLNGTPEFGNWENYSIYNQSEIEELSQSSKDHFPKIAIYYFLQYHLHLQLSEAHEYARSKGIAIKGDIPIGVSPRSVDAWTDPQLFNTQVQAGAPPDDFSVTGQNWGFPTYNWQLMAQDGYQWWKKRFQKLSEYFDAYRIDHILGFFRIWQIPINDVWGLTGSFNPALPFTKSELENKGLWWNEERYLKPYMKEHVLYSTFGKYTDDVKREYLLTDGWQNYKFKPEYDTQKKIEKHFAALGYNFGNKEVLIRDGLYMLHCEVLFVRDTSNSELFHPRISMHSSLSFKDLNDETRRVLDKIYVDYFYHRHNDFWKKQALQKLPALISATNMLVCGEDLGMVPDSVPEVMNSLEILSLEIQRMPKKPNVEFAMPADAPYMSVCTTSTHDMNPIRAWWEEDEALTQRFYNRGLNMPGPAPAKCEEWIADKIIEQHLNSKAMWIILPWQDWMALSDKLSLEHPNAERINVPSNPRNFWCYRMHISLEKLLKQEKFNNKISKMISNSGR